MLPDRVVGSTRKREGGEWSPWQQERSGKGKECTRSAEHAMSAIGKHRRTLKATENRRPSVSGHMNCVSRGAGVVARGEAEERRRSGGGRRRAMAEARVRAMERIKERGGSTYGGARQSASIEARRSAAKRVGGDARRLSTGGTVEGVDRGTVEGEGC